METKPQIDRAFVAEVLRQLIDILNADNADVEQLKEENEELKDKVEVLKDKLSDAESYADDARSALDNMDFSTD